MLNPCLGASGSDGGFFCPAVFPERVARKRHQRHEQLAQPGVVPEVAAWKKQPHGAHISEGVLGGANPAHLPLGLPRTVVKPDHGRQCLGNRHPMGANSATSRALDDTPHFSSRKWT